MAAAAAAKLLQSCPTLCDPIDSSPPGSPIPGILKARILEWVAISFSSASKWRVKVKSLSRARPSATPWTAAFQAPLSLGFSRQEDWSGVPLPSPLVLFYVWENAEVLAYWNYSFDYLGRVYSFFPAWIPSGYIMWGRCRGWWLAQHNILYLVIWQWYPSAAFPYAPGISLHYCYWSCCHLLSTCYAPALC